MNFMSLMVSLYLKYCTATLLMGDVSVSDSILTAVGENRTIKLTNITVLHQQNSFLPEMEESYVWYVISVDFSRVEWGSSINGGLNHICVFGIIYVKGPGILDMVPPF